MKMVFSEKRHASTRYSVRFAMWFGAAIASCWVNRAHECKYPNILTFTLMFRVLPPASPPPFVVSSFRGCVADVYERSPRTELQYHFCPIHTHTRNREESRNLFLIRKGVQRNEILLDL